MVINEYTNGHGSQADGHSNGYTNGYTNDSLNRTISVPNGTPTAKQIPIAICGMGMRLPGGIRNDAALYDFLVNKQDARGPTPNDRYNVDAYYSPHAKHGTIITKHGYFLEDIDFSKFDASMFSMTPAEVEQVDPTQRMVLEVVREALESSGETEWRGKNIGSYVGVFTEDWQDLHGKDTSDYGPYQIIGKMDFAISNRIAYEYDLKGPSMTIKTACSSAGLCLHQALQAIRQGEISAAIVSGANLIMAPGMTIGMSVQLTLSPDGTSKSFDASANGYARGEGVTALYVKRLDEAIRDGNPVRAIIRSSASNADGKTAGIAMPNPEAHEAVIRQAYAAAGLNFSQTAMVEAHGTGTPVGDPLEVEAIAKCFGEEGVYLGAVKPNMGHSGGAAAITSVMKAVLSLENRTIIPNIKFNTPNPAIPWENAKLVVPLEPCPWPENRSERMSVNSYGIGGSNVHFILDSASSFGLAAPKSNSSPLITPTSALKQQERRKTLLLFSANHSESLKMVVQNHASYLEKHPDRLDDLAYTLAQRRGHLKLRSFCVTDGSAPFEVSPQAKFQGPSQAAFLFTGQGAQWVHMGKQLMLDYPSFLASIRSMDEVLEKLEHAPLWSIEGVLLKEDDKSIIGKAEYSQPICTALQIALVDLLAGWDITPLAVVGHSSGEIAAAYAAGALTMKEAIIAAFYRGYVCKKRQKNGGMVAIGIGRSEVTQYLVPGVKVACENSASGVTLSGDMEPLESVTSKIKERMPNVLVRRLQVEMAYHSGK
jgi:acyl transferase domain-containing protein